MTPKNTMIKIVLRKKLPMIRGGFRCILSIKVATTGVITEGINFNANVIDIALEECVSLKTKKDNATPAIEEPRDSCAEATKNSVKFLFQSLLRIKIIGETTQHSYFLKSKE